MRLASAIRFAVSVLVNCFVQDAIQLGASALHIEPWETAIAVRARANGVLIELAHLPLDLMEKVSVRFTVMSNRLIDKAGMLQDGTAVGGPELDGVQLRVSILPTTRGCSISATGVSSWAPSASRKSHSSKACAPSGRTGFPALSPESDTAGPISGAA
jgi:hypothetical protein